GLQSGAKLQAACHHYSEYVLHGHFSAGKLDCRSRLVGTVQGSRPAEPDSGGFEEQLPRKNCCSESGRGAGTRRSKPFLVLSADRLWNRYLRTTHPPLS